MKIKNFLIDFKNSWKWKPIFIMLFFITLVFMLDDDFISVSWLLKYLMILGSLLVLLIYSYFMNKSTDRRERIRRKEVKDFNLKLYNNFIDEHKNIINDDELTKLLKKYNSLPFKK